MSDPKCCGVPVACETPDVECSVRAAHAAERGLYKPLADVGATPLATQVGGGHYKDMAIQPVEYILANKLGFVEGCVVKYVSRWQAKGGVEDLKKARHFLDILIDHAKSQA